MILFDFIKLVLIATVFLWSGVLYGQNDSDLVKGKVVDPGMSPVALATVGLYSSSGILVSSTNTDSLGTFQLRGKIPGKYFIAVKHLGYQDYRSTLFDLANSNLEIVKLSRQENKLEAVTVEGKRAVLTVDGGTIVYQVENSIGAQDISAFDALKRAPGVQIENEVDITLNGKSGVQILLDGRQTFLSGKELSDLLKSMSSNNIRSIEIVNSPSAKYDASGAAGIINIKTKKNQLKGLNGSITSAFAYGVSPKQLQHMTFNYRVNKLNVFGSYNHTLGHYNYLYGTNRQQNGKSYDSHTVDVDKRQKMGAQVGIDYFLNDKNTIGLLVNGNFIFGGGLTNTATTIATLPSVVLEGSLDAINDYYGQSTKRYNFNLNYKYEDTLGRSLNVDLDYGLLINGIKTCNRIPIGTMGKCL
ncbi:TonB-dependent receptor [Sphingobacterium sp. E70]|uniref:TonB-dependent receptor n=1 Tax=Sphingobacterium sp. E70 TaxID=2853439 RepID=UPI00211B9393|nr:TonB-dependent receptor [Sphingobacterium sp. E70]ULT25568.1 TonB-dependent receptor [Sphingobacterium sp. E70]